MKILTKRRFDNLIREAQLKALSHVWGDYKMQYPDGELEPWLRSFIVAYNIKPEHFKENKE